jgi:ankyrin repeat protein
MRLQKLQGLLKNAALVQITLTYGWFLTSLVTMKLLLKSLVLFVGLAAASPAVAFSYSCADWKDLRLRFKFWMQATPAIIADCVQDMGFAMGFSVNDRNELGATPLHLAAGWNPNPAVVTTLLQAGADINARNEGGETPLHIAPGNFNFDVFRTLLEAGADVNARDQIGNTPLHEAVEHASNPGDISALINAGADINARSKGGKTPLHWAALVNLNPDVITTLLQAGADVYARDANGATPLHLAADLNPNPDVITTLLQAGADGSTKDNDGKTPFDLAEDNEAIKNTDAYWTLNDARFK